MGQTTIENIRPKFYRLIPEPVDPAMVYLNTVMRRLTTGIRSEKCVVRPFRHCANVYLHKPIWSSLLHTWVTRYSLLLLGYKHVQHVTVLNTVGNCNGKYYNIIL